eukprot:gene10922-14661_t
MVLMFRSLCIYLAACCWFCILVFSQHEANSTKFESEARDSACHRERKRHDHFSDSVQVCRLQRDVEQAKPWKTLSTDSVVQHCVARKGLELVASSHNLVGPAVVSAHHALRPLNAKQKTGRRPTSSRLQLLCDLVTTYARDLVVAIQRILGTPAVQSSCLDLLRPKQKEEYEAHFQASPRMNGPPLVGGKVNTSSFKMNIDNNNDGWTENDLDIHYWKDCPILLISCPSCAQIVEIAGLLEHLLDECNAKDSYVPCDVTGLVEPLIMMHGRIVHLVILHL